MRIGVLEWVCGGGMSDIAIEHIAASLRAEAISMIRAVADDFTFDGFEVALALDPRLLDATQFQNSNSRFRVHSDFNFQNGLPGCWWTIAEECDAVLLVAPEFSDILQTATELLAPVCKLLMNCRGEFLSVGCDKWQLAQRLREASISHPATCLLRDADDEWLQKHRLESGRWVTKPRDGAGCEGLRLFDDRALRMAWPQLQGKTAVAEHILQPWHEGAAFSRSAIVDAAGRPHWLPLVTQEFERGDSLTYLGAEVLAVRGKSCVHALSGESFPAAGLDKLLDATLAAMGKGGAGWVGVDLIFEASTQAWMIIEVNPRLTTSFAELNRDCGGGLMTSLWSACCGNAISI